MEKQEETQSHGIRSWPQLSLAIPKIQAILPHCWIGGCSPLGTNLVVQHCHPSYRAIGYSYTYRIYDFQCIAGYRAIPPPFGGIAKSCWGGGFGGSGDGGVSQLKPALCAIGRYRGVSQLYCRKSWLDGPLRDENIT